MSRESMHRRPGKRPGKCKPENEELTVNVELYLNLFNECGELDWHEYYYEFGNEALSDFSDDDYRNLREQLPSLPTKTLELMTLNLYPEDQNHMMILEELIHIADNAELFTRIMGRLFCKVHYVSDKYVSEFMEKALRFLNQESSYAQDMYIRVIRELNNRLPQRMKSRP